MAERYIAWFNATYSRQYQVRSTTLQLVRRLHALGYTDEDLRWATVYRARRWLDDGKMADYVRPATMLTVSGIEKVIDDARREARHETVDRRRS